MQNIYLSNSGGKTNDLGFFKRYNKGHKKIKTEDFTLDLFYTEGNDSIYEAGEFFMANLGIFIYGDEYNRRALELFFRDLMNGNSLKKMLLSNETRGQFCLILYADNTLKIITDRLGYFPLCCYKKSAIEISNSFMVLARNNETTLNYQGIAEYLSENIRGYACCDKNIVNEITILNGGSIYTLDKERLTEERYYNIKDDLLIGRYNSFDEVVSLAEKTLSGNLSFLKKVNGIVHSDITGGFDTRVNIANLVRLGVKAHYGIQLPVEYRHYTNTGRYSEFNIVNRISRHYNLDIDISDDSYYWENRELIDDITFNMSNKLTYNRRTGYFLQLKEKWNINLVVSGLSGTELLRQPYVSYFNRNKKLNIDTFLRENYPLVDVMKDGLLPEEAYYDNLKGYFETKLDGLKYERAEDLGSYIDYFAFYRTHFCRYLVLANSVMPFYTPYGDFTFAKLMYETSYKLKSKFRIQRTLLAKLDCELASIDTTRGFPATRVTCKNFYRFLHMISRDIPQQYFSLPGRLASRASLSFLRFLFSHNGLYNLINSVFPVKDNEATRLNLEHRADEIAIMPILKRTLDMNLPVFDIVDRDRLGAMVKRDCNFNILNRVLLLNRILEDIKNDRSEGGL